jgi:hypothetical protein
MRKLRCCDNAKASSTNDNTRMCESIVSPSFEFPTSICAHIAAKCANSKTERPDMVLGLDDLIAAFRRVPSSQPQFTVVALFDYDVETEDRRKSSTTPGIRFTRSVRYEFWLKIRATPIQQSGGIHLHSSRRLAQLADRPLL